MSPLAFAAIAVGLALLVAAHWWRRAARSAVAESALDATVAVRISRHDALGIPSKPVSVREPGRVRAIVRALGVDAQPSVTCPPDYASADVGLLLSGRDVYARRNVYVWRLLDPADAGSAPTVLVTSSAGCRGGPSTVSAERLREILLLEPGLDAGR